MDLMFKVSLYEAIAWDVAKLHLFVDIKPIYHAVKFILFVKR